MKIVILRSRRRESGQAPPDAYMQEFSSAYAERVIANIRGEPGDCAACGPNCNACRTHYDRKLADNIVADIEFPSVLGYLLENPAELVPTDIPPHDIILAINIHEQILLEIIKLAGTWGTRGVIAPLEAQDWISGSAKKQAESISRSLGVEISFPKPFCDFAPPAGGVLDEFRREFAIGRPEVELTVKDGRIENADVRVSAACGATYYVARGLIGKRVDDDLKYEIVAKRMHSYPCTASMEWDYALGDTVMHVASKAHDKILAPLSPPGQDQDADADEMMLSPLGVMIHKPAADRENVQNVELAKAAILQLIAADGETSLEKLRSDQKITPAAAYTALLLLTSEGCVRAKGDKILPV